MVSKEVINKIVKGVVNGLKSIKFDLERGMVERAPRDTGWLAQHIFISKETDSGYTITAATNYASFVEEGTGRIEVGTPEQPRTSWPAKTRHGSTQGTTMPYMAPTIIQNRNRISKSIVNGISGEFR